MKNQVKTIETGPEEELEEQKTEPIRDRRVYLPRADIYETVDELVLVMDVPGADDQSVEVTLDKNILTVSAYPVYAQYEGHALAYAEYGEGDFQRSFALSDEIDRSRLEARVKNGVLHLHLPKVGEVKPYKVSVKAG